MGSIAPSQWCDSNQRDIMKLFLVLIPFLVSVYGCAAMNTIPEDAVPLSNEEIVKTFSGVTESYKGRDIPGMTATGKFGADGRFEASWSVGKHKGVAIGEWYAENGKRCLKEEKPNGETNLECIEFYKTGDVYTSLNENGSVHGIHSLTPLE